MNMKQTFLYSALHRDARARRRLILTELLHALAVLGACGAASLAIDQVFLGKGSLSTTAPVLLVLFVMLGALHFIGLWQSRLQQSLSGAVRKDVREKLHARLLSREGQTDQRFTRELLPLALESTDALDAWYTRVLPVVLGIAITMPCLLLAAFLVDPMTGLLMLVTVPIAPFLLYLIGRVTREASEAQWRAMNRFSAGLAEILRALPTLKLFARERAERQRVRGLSEDFAGAALRVLQLSFVSAFALELITTLAIAIIAVSIGLRLLYGQLTFSAAFFVLLLTPEFYQPLRLSGTAFHSGMTAHTAESSLLKASSVAPATRGVSVVGAIAPKGVQVAQVSLSPSSTREESLTVCDLSFRYPGSPLPLLSGIQFTVPKSSLTVLAGPSGCGKTTLLRLLAGLLLPESGQIARADALSYVPQEPHLYNATLFENITLFQQGYDEASVRKALKALCLSDWAEALPQGLMTPLGEGGQSLSQGQRKRLGLARALVQDRPLILLDEPTAALDERTAATIREVLLALKESGRHTLFVISHDERLQAAADTVLDLDALQTDGAATRKGGDCP
ncbi:ATP-binding cassette domain-containing protein [Mitsuokella multacida]|uniref:ATP-binding cassette domain-containing protein n=3 Tax=Mitsuokella multacida TaxID=52226 RepID=A0A414NYL0_9FIRM|nr:ATP-binding cassette domain-containing protein [Mitsuokella multacida]RHF52838.1 ATP-binding cassette domain-containing protein [Mitsuokella multacida]